jgi:hypothetical protein
MDKGRTCYECSGPIANFNISGLCRACHNRIKPHEYAPRSSGFNLSTDWFTDALGIFTRYHGDV